MPLAWAALLLAVAYLGLLFCIASWADRRAARGATPIDRASVYTLSLAVYCTAWTFYGSVGLAATSGLAFLPVYLGPTIVALLFGSILVKIVRITTAYGITSIADFISARYAKSTALGAFVTVVAVVGVVPYISLQLKAVAGSVQVMLEAADDPVLPTLGADTALLVTLVLAAFTILFGTRKVDATEHHEGMVLAIAFESVVKLICFLVVGAFIVWVVAGGIGHVGAAVPSLDLADLLSVGGGRLGYTDWLLLTLLSAVAFVVLPRQFQVAVIENVRPAHIRRAAWLLPLYLLVINLFVVPIALVGLMAGVPLTQADSYVLLLPLSVGADWVALLAFLGGLSAATAMVIVETVALSTMISNNLVMPLLLRLRFLRLDRQPRLTALVLMIRRSGILLVLLAGWLFFEIVGARYGLASIGLISFTAVAQFAPPILAGLYWQRANVHGAMAGLAAGVAVWLYTLVLPAFAGLGEIPGDIATAGPFDIALLAPHALFGMDGLHPVAHSTLWSLSLNAGLLAVVSLLTRQSALERFQAALWVDVERTHGTTRPWRGEARVSSLRALLERFLGSTSAEAVFQADERHRGRRPAPDEPIDASLVQSSERRLARAIGTASARVVMGSIVRREVIGPEDLMEILDETSRVIDYSRRLEQKSTDLERISGELRAANERLRELDRLKDDFVATVSHELRTPLTSIRSFSEILHDDPTLSEAERQRFLGILVRETERLTRLIDDLLDLSRIEAGQMEWTCTTVDVGSTVAEACAATGRLLAAKEVTLSTRLPETPALVSCDRDRLQQVLLNLLSNAAKFSPPGGRVQISVSGRGEPSGLVEVRVEDAGPGVPEAQREAVFEKFRQVSDTLKTRPQGSGLGLAISREIVERFGGRIWVERSGLGGAAICFVLPRSAAAGLPRAAE